MVKIPARVLIVDDEQDFAEMLALRLQEVGQKVLTAHSGRSCLDRLKEETIDVVILDILMPGMNGIDTLKEIKRHFPIVEVIMLTGHGTIQTAVEGMKRGAYDYLLKPADFKELLAKLDGARKRKDEQEERIRRAEAKTLLRRSGDI